MSDYRAVHSEVFVLRFWQEASSGTWRGQAVRMASRETFPFASWEQVQAILGRFIRGLLEQPPATPPL